MQKLKNSKGITLIALIITIIVMLILVGVTINVALNGGLIEKARTAQSLTQKQVEKEELIIAALGAYDEKTNEVNLSQLEEAINNLSNVYTDKSVKSSKYVLTGPSGTVWQIDLTTAEVKEYEEQINPWVGRGLSSTEVTYDTAYTGSAAIDGDLVFTSINFKSNGDIENNVQSAQSSDIDDVISAGSVYIDSSNNLFVWRIAGDVFVGFLIDSNEAKVYKHTSASNIITNGTYCGSLYVTPPAPSYPLSGKTFTNPIMETPSMGTSGMYVISFADDTFEFMGKTGTYTYNSSTKTITLTLTDFGIENQSTQLYTIQENGETVNSYFYLMGSAIMTEHKTDGMAPFSGTFSTTDTGATINSIVFSTHNGYGCEYVNGSETPLYYCYDEQNSKINILSGGDSAAKDCSYTQDQQGNYTSITIDGTLYSLQS